MAKKKDNQQTQDHDQRLKVAVATFLLEALELLVPEWVERYDVSKPEWLQQEVFLNPPKGEKRLLDLVARVKLKQTMGKATEALLHFELESREKLTLLRKNMPQYRTALKATHGLPTLSLGLYLAVELNGSGWDEATHEHFEETIDRTRWPYLALPGLDAMRYVEGKNMLGVAFSVLMRVADQDKAKLKARAMQRIAAASLTPTKRFLLMEIAEAYLPLHGPHLDEFQRLLTTEDYKMALELAKTSREQGLEEGLEKGREEGLEQGLEKGREEGRRETLWRLLKLRFEKKATKAIRTQLDALSDEQLDAIEKKLISAKSLDDLGLGVVTNGTPSAAS